MGTLTSPVHFCEPVSNRVYKKSGHAKRKYVVDPQGVVDITGNLPVILMDLNLTDSSLKKKYIYVADPVGADRQILAQHHIDTTQSSPDDDKLYFCLHDRLGSVRLVLGDNGDVVKYYTYEPFGQVIESSDGPPVTSDAFLFTGQYFDAEIEEYYLRASSLRDISVGDRSLWDMQYNPQIARFTSRDPVEGNPKEPLTLHKYLYSLNDSIDWADPSGETALNVANALIAVTEMYAPGPTK